MTIDPVALGQLRPPAQVMRLARMGSFHHSRLSFLRILIRTMQSEAWTFDRPRFDFDAEGRGTGLYTATTPERTYTLVAFGHHLEDDQRSDRVIATAWDATFALHDGVPTDEDVERLRANVPQQEAGRVSERELTLSRANRSMRVWEPVIDALAAGHQPDARLLEDVGYLMRTTAVYGSGKFGAADREVIADRTELRAPFQAEMLTVYLIRSFVADLVEHLAAQRSASAVVLDPALRRSLGVGNSTGLGMAPFLLNHPRLINNWIMARERALATVRSTEPTAQTVAYFTACLADSRARASWRSEHPMQQQKQSELLADLDLIEHRLALYPLVEPQGWDQLISWSEHALSLEGQELLVSLVLEPHGEVVDAFAGEMHADETDGFWIDGSVSIDHVIEQIDTVYQWARDIDWQQPTADARAWYVSEEKLEPRLGERHKEPIADYEQPLQPGRDAVHMRNDLIGWRERHGGSATLAGFLSSRPQHRHIARRLQILATSPYGEIRDNTIGAELVPIDLLRSKLSFFGATRFDPRSDRWVRISLFPGAPYPHELHSFPGDQWLYPISSTH